MLGRVWSACTLYDLAMLGRLSLATKCLLLFGAAVVFIISAALAVPWVRMNGMVDDAETEISRQIVATWEQATVIRGGPATSESATGPSAPGESGAKVGATPSGSPTTPTTPGVTTADGTVSKPESSDKTNKLATLQAGRKLFANDAKLTVLAASEIEHASTRSQFVQRAWRELSPSKAGEYVEAAWQFTVREYRYAKAVRDGSGVLEGLVLLERTSPAAAQGMLFNTLYLFAAGCVALGLAVAVFYLVTNRIILSPVRDLRETAEQVREGNLAIRSQIQTRDEFEDLADAFNEMLAALQAQQGQLRAINASLDEKLGELTERNTALFEAAKLKGEFLANVTHELRTPLNSILGFAELLEEGMGREAEGDADAGRSAKRKRYIENILGAGRALLELINGLLEMAKVEAGKVDLRVRDVDIRERCEQLAAMMKPVADKRGVELKLEAAADLPLVKTDGPKLQQIVFNLLSNAIKFTADAAEAEREAVSMRQYTGEIPGPVRQALVTLRAERLVPRAAEGPDSVERVRISILDTGPGIAKADLDKIFEKFTQLDTGYTRKHAGTGLGLAICKELTHLLQGEMQVQSEVGLGSMFSVIIPVQMDATAAAQLKMELEFRGALTGRGEG